MKPLVFGFSFPVADVRGLCYIVKDILLHTVFLPPFIPVPTQIFLFFTFLDNFFLKWSVLR